MMEIKINGIYKKRFGELSVKVINVTNKMVIFTIDSITVSSQKYRLNINNFMKYYCEDGSFTE